MLNSRGMIFKHRPFLTPTNRLKRAGDFQPFLLGFWDVLRHPNPQHPKGIQISAVDVTWGPWGSRRVPFEIAAVPAPKVLLQYAKTKRSLGKARVILCRICSNSLLGDGKWFVPGFLYRSTISSELSELATCSCASTFEVDGGSEQNQSKAVLAEFVPSFQLNRQNTESLELEVWDSPSDDQCSRESSRIIFIAANHIKPLWMTISRWQILSQQQAIWTSLQSNPSCLVLVHSKHQDRCTKKTPNQVHCLQVCAFLLALLGFEGDFKGFYGMERNSTSSTWMMYCILTKVSDNHKICKICKHVYLI